jgi:uncharacterized protein
VTSTSTPQPAAPHRSRRIIAVSLAIIAALVVGFFAFANLYADWMWYDQLGFVGVLSTQWIARVVMFVVGFLGMAVPVWGVIQFAYRLRPVYARLSSQLDRYQEVVEPLRRLAMWGIPIFFGFFAGFSASAQWETTWLWFNGVTTDVVDPQFGLDTGFYMFAMPFYGAVLGFASAVVLVCLLLTAVVSYLYGSVRVGQRELRISKAARIQLAVLAGLYILLQGGSLWLDRFRTMVESGALGRITGPGYTETHATIPGQTILAIAAAIVAVLFFVTAIVGRWRYPLIATALLVVSSLVLGVGYPWIVNTFQVTPNQQSLQSEFFQRNIDMTQQAFGVDGVVSEQYEAETVAEAGQLREDASTTAQIRIMDPAVIGPTVRQLEQYRAYYQFPGVLDVDRYEIDGQSQDTVVGVRELDVDELGDGATWENSTLVYTHGYGLVAAAGNERTDDGNPVFLEQGIPADGFLTEEGNFEPRVYFGEQSPTYSIVGAPEGSDPIELDYPLGTDGGSTTSTTFEGDGGPSVGNVFSRLIYALKFQSEQILFSDSVNADSQILYDRDPKERVEKVAPYLTLDSDPYPTVVDGRIKWVLDGYTTSANYPYSSGVSLSEAIADSTNTSPRYALDQINYIRNSVKATVDAYDGSVTLYAWEPNDPVLQTWQNVYPTDLHSIDEMSADLMSHVRYPTDLFKVQRNILGVYHVDDANTFYQQNNRWQTPDDPQDNAVLQPPYYLTMQMPGQEVPTYSMFTSFIPASEGNTRNVLTGYLAVDSNAGNEAGVKGEGYGTLRLLEIDSQTTVPGPGQVQNTFDSDPAVSSQINILSQGQSDVINGNLLTLPVGGGLLYVQPVFVQSSGSTQLPQLRRVLVAFGNQIAFEPTLSEALDSLFGGSSGAETGDEDVTPTDPETEPTDPGTEPTEPTEPTTEYQAALQEASAALTAREQALQAGDFAAFGEADERLTAAVERLLALEEAGASGE